jgi:Zn-dependent protease
VAVIVLCHELGHSICFRLLRIWSTVPIFLPLTGALVITKAHARNRRGYGWCVLAGPLFGFTAIALTVALADTYGSRLLQAWAVIGAVINLFNLLPLPGLDGGVVVRAAMRHPRGRWTLVLAWLGTAFATTKLLTTALGLFAPTG